jgi:hypothetical protein
MSCDHFGRRWTTLKVSVSLASRWSRVTKNVLCVVKGYRGSELAGPFPVTTC